MNPCLTYNSSLRFARSFFGVVALLAYFLQSEALVLVLGVIMAVAAISLKHNIVYQFHFLVLRKFFKTKDEPVAKDSAELSLACGIGASFLLIPSMLFAFDKWVGLAWAMVLLSSFLMLLAGITGACVASIMYATLKKALKK
ncbi:DUF4395 family protein [Candidatus Parcubacteria bacterium]|nr:DUF4395 family protein [Patescibacteria group bacterium]MBU4466453.1 DUF4395 family protein [Patescibacteria group bacterium]MCG2688082.1 DUF4395 family protein [Candidatus Parcubacteria bacterium]